MRPRPPLAPLLALLLAAPLQAQDGPRRAEVPGHGAEQAVLEVSIRRRPAAGAPVGEERVPGQIRATFHAEAGPDDALTITRSFTHACELSLRSTFQDRRYLLVRLEIVRVSDGETLADLGYGELANLALEEPPTAVIVAVGPDEAAPPELLVRREVSPPILRPAPTTPIPLTRAFEEPAAILRAEDLEATLTRLRGVATATEDYHQALLDLAEEAEVLDLAHLHLLLDACTWPLESIERFRRELERRSRATEPDRPALERLRQNMQLAWRFGPFTNRIAAAGIPKLPGLTWPEARDLLRRLYPGGASDAAVEAAARALGALPAGPLRELVGLAAEKGAHDAAQALSLAWFVEHSDRTPATLLELVRALPGAARDGLLRGGLEHLSALDLDDAMALADASHAARTELALRLVARLPRPTPARVARFVRAVLGTGSSGDRTIQAALPRLEGLDVEGILTLVEACYAIRLEVARTLTERLGSLTPAQLVKLVREGFGTGSSGDALIRHNLDRLTEVDLDGIEAVVGAAYAIRREVALALLARRERLTTDELVGLVRSCFGTGATGDAVLLAGVGRLGDLDTDDLARLVEVAYAKRLELTRALLPRTGKLRVEELVAFVKRCFGTGTTGDAVLELGLDQLEGLDLGGLITLVGASYADRLELTLRLLPRLGELDPGAVQRLVKSCFGAGTTGDRVLAAALPRLRQEVSVDEVVDLVGLAYASRLELARTLLPRIPALDAAGLLRIVERCFGTGTTGDALLLEGTQHLTGLDADGLRAIVSRGYAKRLELLDALLPRLERLSADDVADLVRGCFGTGTTGDRVLMTCIGRLSAVEADDLAALVSLAYAKRSEVALALLARLEGRLSADQAAGLVRAHSGSTRQAILEAVLERVDGLTPKTLAELAELAPTRAGRTRVMERGLELLDGGD